MSDEKRSFREQLRNVGTIVELLLTIGATLFMVTLVLAQFDNSPPMRIEYSDEHVTTVPGGGAFFVVRTTCLDRNKMAHAQPRLVSTTSELVIPLPPKPLSAPLGCHKFRVLVKVPEEVPAGEYRYLITYRFSMNPFKSLDVDLPPVNVTVTK